MPRWIGVDLGTRRIGLALSDSKGTLATPYLTLDRTSDEHDARAIAEIAAAERVKEVVLGHPLKLDGTRGAAAFVTEAFAEKLKAAGAKVKLFDERLTTVEATKKLQSKGVKARQQRGRIDKAAATVLLQAFLDTKKR
ncbi:MAG TPA: Holliday junction resolvase RuvX [Actinomycetota bacterium]|jgi:putative Holliday junction resolvase